MWPLIVVVGVPDAEGVCSLLLGDPLAGVEEFLGQDPVIAFDFPVVTWRVGGDALVAGAESGEEHACGGDTKPIVVVLVVLLGASGLGINTARGPRNDQGELSCVE